MKVRGKLTVSGDIILPKLKGTVPIPGRFLRAGSLEGHAVWEKLVIEPVSAATRYGAGEIVVHTDPSGDTSVYLATPVGATSDGFIDGFPNDWKKLGGIELSDDIIAGLESAHKPNATNEFVTKADMIATEIYFSPVSGLISDDVQGAIEELRTAINNLPTGGGGSTGTCDCVSTRVIGPYPIGTPLEDIIYGFHVVDSISNFRIKGNPNTTVLYALGLELIDPEFVWNNKGLVTDIKLSDDQGNAELPIPSTYSDAIYRNSYNTAANPISPYESVIWTLSARVNGTLVNQTIRGLWGVEAYYGYTSNNGEDDITPDANYIINQPAPISNKIFADLRSIIRCPISNDITNAKYYWIAVPSLPTLQKYQSWETKNENGTGQGRGIDDNNGVSGSNLMYIIKNAVNIGGIDYDIYRTAYETSFDPYLLLSVKSA